MRDPPAPNPGRQGGRALIRSPALQRVATSFWLDHPCGGGLGWGDIAARDADFAQAPERLAGRVGVDRSRTRRRTSLWLSPSLWGRVGGGKVTPETDPARPLDRRADSIDPEQENRHPQPRPGDRDHRVDIKPEPRTRAPERPIAAIRPSGQGPPEQGEGPGVPGGGQEVAAGHPAGEPDDARRAERQRDQPPGRRRGAERPAVQDSTSPRDDQAIRHHAPRDQGHRGRPPDPGLEVGQRDRRRPDERRGRVVPAPAAIEGVDQRQAVDREVAVEVRPGRSGPAGPGPGPPRPGRPQARPIPIWVEARTRTRGPVWRSRSCRGAHSLNPGSAGPSSGRGSARRPGASGGSRPRSCPGEGPGRPRSRR